MSKIVPTVGRVMWYYRNSSQIVPYPCSVCYVYEGEEMVNVAGFDRDGDHFKALNVPVVQEGEPKPEGCDYVTWMPYQMGQAAKTEAAERAAAEAAKGG